MSQTDSPSGVPDTDIQAIRAEFVAKMWKGLLLVALISVPVTLWRMQSLGWLPIFRFHLGLAVVIGGIALVQHRFRPHVSAAEQHDRDRDLAQRQHPRACGVDGRNRLT